MIDLRALREDPDRFRASQRARGESESLIDDLLAADEQRRAAVARFEVLRAEQKLLGKQVAKAQGEEKQLLLARTKELAQQVKAAELAGTQADAALRAAQLAVPNLVEDGVAADGEDDFTLLREVGDRPDFGQVRDHLELGELLGAIDTERGAKVSGARFYFLTGQGALLQLAIQQAVESGFTPVIPPVLVQPETMEGTGFLGAHASEIGPDLVTWRWKLGLQEEARSTRRRRGVGARRRARSIQRYGSAVDHDESHLGHGRPRASWQASGDARGGCGIAGDRAPTTRRLPDWLTTGSTSGTCRRSVTR